MKHKRKTADIRKEEIIGAALALVGDGSYKDVQRKDVAEAVGVSPAAISHHFSTKGQMQRAMMRKAIADKNLVVLAQGLVAKDDQAVKAPDALRREAMASYL